MLGTLVLLLGTGGLGLKVLMTCNLSKSYRVIGGGLAMVSCSGCLILAHWLTISISDSFLETQIAATGPPVMPLNLPDPSLPGGFRVNTLTYGSGHDKHRSEYGRSVNLRTTSVDASPFLKDFKGLKAKLRKWDWSFGKEALPINGRVWYPDGPGPFPLILCVHGNHRAQHFSDSGYSYLGERLATRGFIFVSVDENFLNYSWEGDMSGENAVRGWMLLKHLVVWRGWNQEPGHVFRGRVDLDRISLIGHSRGGEAVVIAATYNRLKHWPEDANQTFNFGFNIRSAVAIAPIEGQYETSDEPTPLRDMDYLVLQGSHDSDVSTFMGQRLFRRLAFTDGRPHFKASLYIHRANHGQFNTIWGDNDLDELQGCLLRRGALLAPEDQRRIALVTIGAFLEATLKEQTAYQAFFQDPRCGAAWLPKTMVLHQFENSTFKPLATFEEDIDPNSTTAPHGRISAEHLTIWKERHVKGRNQWDFRHKAVWLGWEQTETAKLEATYTIELPPGFTQETRLSRNHSLVLTLADTDDDPHVEKEPDGKSTKKADTKEKKDGLKEKKGKNPVDFTVELITNDGLVSALPLSSIRPLQPVLKVQLNKWVLFEKTVYEKSWEPIFQTFEIPLMAFEQPTPAFKPEQLQTIRLRFNKSPKGVVILDQAGFTSRF